MNIFSYSVGASLCFALVACGSSPKPAVEPAPQKVETKTVEVAPVQKFSLDTPTKRYSYALGMDLGRAVANINVPLDVEVLLDAIKDQVDTSRKVLMDDSTSAKALQDLLAEIEKQKIENEKLQAQKALSEQAQILAANAMDSTIKTTTKGVQYKILKEGSGLIPKLSDKVQVHYVGALLDGTEFDNSVKRGEPLEFPVNAVIEGWQDLLIELKEGEKVKAWIPSALAYGEEGVPPMIPKNAMLVFEVELIKVFADVPAVDSTQVVPAEPKAADSVAK